MSLYPYPSRMIGLGQECVLKQELLGKPSERDLDVGHSLPSMSTYVEGWPLSVRGHVILTGNPKGVAVQLAKT